MSLNTENVPIVRYAPLIVERGFAASVALHVIVFVAVGLLPTQKSPSSSTEQSITVELLTEPPVVITTQSSTVQSKSESAALPVPAEQALEQDAKPAVSGEPSSQPDGMVRVKKLLSAKVLADPRSKAALVALRTLGREDRVIQLCNVEAMEQVHLWKSDVQPDFLVAYATADTKLSGLTLQVDGGALRSKHRWYDIKFRCEVTPDLENVVAFEFSLGAKIPESEWQTLSLPVGDGPAD